jgi:hypothetical protein
VEKVGPFVWTELASQETERKTAKALEERAVTFDFLENKDLALKRRVMNFFNPAEMPPIALQFYFSSSMRF